MSARFNPAARTRTRTRSAVGCGASATSRISRPSTPPKEVIVTARIFNLASSSNRARASNAPQQARRFGAVRLDRPPNREIEQLAAGDICQSESDRRWDLRGLTGKLRQDDPETSHRGPPVEVHKTRLPLSSLRQPPRGVLSQTSQEFACFANSLLSGFEFCDPRAYLVVPATDFFNPG